jgi:hypothetical protein
MPPEAQTKKHLFEFFHATQSLTGESKKREWLQVCKARRDNINNLLLELEIFFVKLQHIWDEIMDGSRGPELT